MTITGYPFDEYDGTDASFEALQAGGSGAYHEFHLNELAMADAQRDFTAACERTVRPGRCTGCEEDAGELIPWTPRERLCWRCTDLQLDLLAIAMGELWADAKA